MREWLTRLVDWLRRDRLDRELREELRFHADHLARDARAAGSDPATAARLARSRLGNLTQIREAARERWSWPRVEAVIRDGRIAWRGLRRTPGFTVTVVATLALGIGANAAMFGIIDELMFRPHPFLREAGRVDRVYLEWQVRGQPVVNGDGHQYARYLDLARWSSQFSRFAAFTTRSLAVGSGEAARERPVTLVSGSFFEFFALTPVAGRLIGPAHDVIPNGAPVVVVSHGYWKNDLGGRDVIGERIRVRNIDCEIIGIAPEGFVGVSDGRVPDVYLPITTFAGATFGQDDRPYYSRYDRGWVAIMAERKPGVTEAAASADLTAALIRSWNVQRDLDPGMAAVEVARPRAIAGPLKTAAGPSAGLEAKTLLWVTGVAGVVLLIACANVTNLMLARVISRRRETAVRLALGVSRARLFGQGMTESAILALLGCLVGLAVAQWGGEILRRVFLEGRASAGVADGRILAAAGLAALFAGLVTGLGPALLAVPQQLTPGLKSGPREGGFQRSRARTGLLVLQAALSVVLLVGAALFVQSLERVRSVRLGYDAEPVVIVTVNLRGSRLDAAERWAFDERLLAVVQGTPGVAHATLASSVPFWSTSTAAPYVPGIDSVGRLGRFTFQEASSDYFATMGTRVLRGRAFTEADRTSRSRVVVVSEAMAAVLWPQQDAIGQCLKLRADTMPCTTVIGIAENATQSSLTEEQRFRYYLPYVEASSHGAEALLARVEGEPATVGEQLRIRLQREMPGEGYVTTRPLAELVADGQRSWRFGATMFVALGGLALVVAAVGLYGVLAYNVLQRRQEFGIRTALGARGGDLVRLVVGQGLRVAGIGALIGVTVSLGAARWIEPLLFRQSATDPVTYLTVVALLLVVAMVASSVPARRATRADPNTALRLD